MTRKRFVKLLMADGYSRNKANSIARETIADGCAYEFQLLLLRVGNDLPDVLLPDLKEAIELLQKTINEILPTVINAIVEALPAAVELAHQRIAALQEQMRMEANNE